MNAPHIAAVDPRMPLASDMPWRRCVAITLLSAACSDPAAEAARAEAQAAAAEMLAVWQRGAEAFEPAAALDRAPGKTAVMADGSVIETVTWTSGGSAPAAPFHGFDQTVREFLRWPSVRDAVQFSCVSGGHAAEEWIEAGLDDPDPVVRLRALLVLVRAHAPRTVDKQWATLQELRPTFAGGPFAQVVGRLETEFAPSTIDTALAGAAPGARYSSAHDFEWFVRAAGVSGHRGALARLAELSASDNLQTSLAAERSLEDFEGPYANAALARCIRNWAYDAGMRAGWTLARRDPELLRSVLLSPDFPTDRAYIRGRMLAALDDPRSVPILCATVAGIAIVDGEMFDQIERLATTEHLELVAALPAQVRDNQRERAASVVANVKQRLGR
jgi:hypothetical protein